MNVLRGNNAECKYFIYTMNIFVGNIYIVNTYL